MVGGHLDSWDLGTGAIDDAAGVAITTAAAHADHAARASRGGRSASCCSAPRRSAAAAGRPISRRNHPAGNVVTVGESDFGADRIWRVRVQLRRRRKRRSPTGSPPARATRHRPRRRHPPMPARTSNQWVRAGVAGDRPQPGRHPLFRLSSHARRHARQGRSGAAPPECRGLDGGAVGARQRAGADRGDRAGGGAGPALTRTA